MMKRRILSETRKPDLDCGTPPFTSLEAVRVPELNSDLVIELQDAVRYAFGYSRETPQVTL
jgi:hypothetical protein